MQNALLGDGRIGVLFLKQVLVVFELVFGRKYGDLFLVVDFGNGVQKTIWR